MQVIGTLTRGLALAALVAAHAAAAEPAKTNDAPPDPQLHRERIGNLGLFAGYVVACGLASETDANMMISKLSDGLGAPFDAKETDLLEKARTAARKVRCEAGPLRDAVVTGWRNYRDVK